ncbi:MAG: hypothetical protein AAF092_04365 [Pseudomonadota bacterium]
MTKLLAALATAVFCACFAFVVDTITDALAAWQIIGFAAASGFFGSLVGNSLFGGKS